MVGNKWAFSRHATYWGRELESFDGFWGFYGAKTLADFEAACRKITTSHNFIAVTKGGKIGYWFTGLYPIRSPKLDPRFPVPGSGDYEWRGLVPVSSLPRCLNPKQGWLGNWNNKPAAWWPNSDTPVWGANQRFSHIAGFMRARKLVSPDNIRALVPDIATYELDAGMFVPLLLRAAARAKLTTAESKGIRMLSVWDYRERDQSAVNGLFAALMSHLREELFQKALGNLGSPDNFRQVTQASYIWHVVGDSPVRPRFDYLAGRTKDAVLLSAFGKAITELVRKHGDLSSVPFTASRMNLQPLPNVAYSNRGTYIQIIEMTRPRPLGFSVLCPGQSEDPKSPHYSDQRDLASWWTYKPMVWEVGSRE
jgi:penicillin amidase